jgi:hypothetical protein
MSLPFCLCVPPLKLLNQVTDLREIWYECYATGGHSNLALLSTVSNNNMADARTCEVGATLAPLNVRSRNGV